MLARSAETAASDPGDEVVEASLLLVLSGEEAAPEKRFGKVYEMPFMFANSSSAATVSEVFAGDVPSFCGAKILDGFCGFGD